jgi:two-component system sensor histidine kinase/response regulator
MSASVAADAVANILIVDDTPANLEVLGGMLKERGYKVRQATSGEMALRTAANNPPDLLLLDIMMPGMDGYETCRQWKADARLQDIPVIFISALAETMDKVKAFGVGGVDFVTKPFQFEEVEARVAAHLALRRQQRLLQASYEELRRLEELRDNLVHMIIHDMRTPLTSIYGFLQTVELLEGESLTADAHEFIGRALSSTENLIEMVSSLLDVSKMEAGQLTLALEDCRLHDIITDVLHKAEGLRENRELRMETADEPVVITADPTLLARVVQNLLGNALKFTPDGGRIIVGVQPGTERVRVTVHDTGPGIPEEFREKIFEKFGQVEARQQRQKHSTGLGLTFCKLAVVAHGGTIGVDSELGAGSTFWFELPVGGPDGGMMPKPAE